MMVFMARWLGNRRSSRGRSRLDDPAAVSRDSPSSTWRNRATSRAMCGAHLRRARPLPSLSSRTQVRGRACCSLGSPRASHRPSIRARESSDDVTSRGATRRLSPWWWRHVPADVATLTPFPARPSPQGWPSLSAPCTPSPPPRPSARPRRVASPRASPPRASRCAPWRTTPPRGLPSTSSSTCASARCSRRPSTRTPTSSTSRRSTSARRSPARSAPVSSPTWPPRSVPDPSPGAHRSPKRRIFSLGLASTGWQ